MKLHLPKMLLTAVLAAVAFNSLAQAGTGWGTKNGLDYLYFGGSAGGSGIYTEGVGTVTWDETSKTLSVASINAVTKGLTSFGMVADKFNDIDATFELLHVANGTTIRGFDNPWGDENTLKKLTIEHLSVADSGSVSFNNDMNGYNISIVKVSGSLSSVNNAGTLTIGTADSTTALNGTITNSGTLTILGAVTVENWDGFQFTYVGGEDATENGLFDMGKKYILLSGNALAEGSTTTFTYNGASHNIADGYTKSEGKIYAVVSGTVTVGGDAATEGTVEADVFLVNGGTLALAEGSLSKNILNYTSGSISLADNTTITGLSFMDDATSANNKAIIAAISGSGTIEVTTKGTVTDDWNQTIDTKTNTGDDAFTGTTYVKSGCFTYAEDKLGTIIRLGTDAHMQVNGGGTLKHDIIVDSGTHEVHINGTNTFTIENKTISGEGTFSKNGPSGTILIKGNTSITNYKNTAGTTTVEGAATITNLTSTDGTTNVSGGTVGHAKVTGGTLNLTGTAAIDGSGNSGNDERYAGLVIDGGEINVGNGTDACTVTTTRLEMADNNNSTVSVKQKATFIVTGNDVLNGWYSYSYWKTGLLLSEWNGTGTLNIAGKMLAMNASASSGDNMATINLENGGILATRGLDSAEHQGAISSDPRTGMQLNLKDGSTLIVGVGGIDVKNFASNLEAGTIGITDDCSIVNNLALSSATGTTFDTQKWVWGENGASISQGTDGGTLTISGAIADYSTTTGEGEEAVTTTSTGKLIKAGAGTLKLTATNTYSGGTDINGGTLEAGANNALGTGEVNIGSAGTLAIANGATFDNIIKGSGTYALGSSTTLQGTLDSTWTGTVSLTGASLSKANLNDYGNTNSTVELSSATGSLAEDTINTNVKFTLADNTPGVKINNTTGKTVTFAGAVSGNGNFVVEATNTSADNYKADTYVFSGDVSNWDTENVGFISATDANVEFTGKATTINNGIYANGGTLNATISGDNAVTVNGDITNSKWSSKGTLNLTVNNTSTEGVTFTNTVKADKATIAAGSKATFTGTTNLDTIALGAGLSADAAAITTSGALTLGKFELDLTTYTGAGEFLLVSKTGNGSINWTEGSWTQTGLADGLTASVGFNEAGDVLSLTISAIVSPDVKDITTTVLDKDPLWDGKTLTLTVDDNLDGVGSVIIEGFEGDVLDKIFALDGMEANTMVGITLVGADGKELSAVPVDDISNIGFRGNDGIYYGQNVDGSTQYNVSYIPEPTTATLSLLALMGLAARRRRK